jgi:hypothetical protein
MSIQEYISSGILESYILGNTTPEEKAEVEKYAATYPEIKVELEEIEKAMNKYVSEHSIVPPTHIKNKILASISVENKTSESAKEKIIKNIQMAQPTEESSFSFWSIAASFLFLVSAGFAIYFYMRVNKLDGYLDNLTKINTNLYDSIKSISSNNHQMENDLAILKDPTYKIVELKGLKPAPDAKAMVCWSPQDKKVYVEIEKLPAAPQGMQYQLWAIVDGKPVSEGMLSPGSGLHRMIDVENAQAFAVTLEKEGGNPAPKGDMYVMGTV